MLRPLCLQLPRQGCLLKNYFQTWMKNAENDCKEIENLLSLNMIVEQLAKLVYIFDTFELVFKVSASDSFITFFTIIIVRCPMHSFSDVINLLPPPPHYGTLRQSHLSDTRKRPSWIEIRLPSLSFIEWSYGTFTDPTFPLQVILLLQVFLSSPHAIHNLWKRVETYFGYWVKFKS